MMSFDTYRVKGSGNVISETRNVSRFHGIDVGSAFEVVLVKSADEKIVIETDDNIMPIIKTHVVNGILEIENTENINDPTKLKATIYYKEINDIELSGAASLTSADVLQSNSLEFECSGAASVQLKLEVGKFDGDFSGASELELSGKADEAKLDLSGASDLKAFDLIINNLQLEASGAASVSVSVSGKMQINASGAASVRYKGDPDIQLEDISGASSVKKM
jgi:hypothetical protein